MVGGRERVTTDYERVLRGGCQIMLLWCTDVLTEGFHLLFTAPFNISTLLFLLFCLHIMFLILLLN